ncbi:MAG: hypothetical protein WA964_19675, partial [Ilumatobacter sp.]|uniref:hypothetical protein n=1 Tax=Ilumatobacter sp. TaxID=1967498 RepID=UPI003C74EFC6
MNASASPLLDLSAATVRMLKRLAFGLAVVAVATFLAARRFGWFDFRPGGASFDAYISPVFAGLFVVAALVALRWEVVGGAVAAFAAAGLVAFASEQLITTHAVLVVALFAVPGAIWLLVAISELSRRGAVAGLGAAAVMALAGFVVGNAIYDSFWGPTHPSSQVAALPDSPVEWVWSGAVTTSTAEVRADPRGDYESVRLAVSTDADLDEPTWVEPNDESGRVVGFRVDDLVADTTYHYAVEVDGELDDIRTGTFATFP